MTIKIFAKPDIVEAIVNSFITLTIEVGIILLFISYFKIGKNKKIVEEKES